MEDWSSKGQMGQERCAQGASTFYDELSQIVDYPSTIFFRKQLAAMDIGTYDINKYTSVTCKFLEKYVEPQRDTVMALL